LGGLLLVVVVVLLLLLEGTLLQLTACARGLRTERRADRVDEQASGDLVPSEQSWRIR
jgi:hypothetical protein